MHYNDDSKKNTRINNQIVYFRLLFFDDVSCVVSSSIPSYTSCGFVCFNEEGDKRTDYVVLC